MYSSVAALSPSNTNIDGMTPSLSTYLKRNALFADKYRHESSLSHEIDPSIVRLLAKPSSNEDSTVLVGPDLMTDFIPPSPPPYCYECA